MLGISQFAHELTCLYCDRPNPATEWRTMGDMVPFYCQRESGKYNLKMTCPHCDRVWYVVWDDHPGEIELLFSAGIESHESATTVDTTSHAEDERTDTALQEPVPAGREDDQAPQRQMIQDIASRLLSDDQSTRDKAIDTAREMATAGDDTGLRGLEQAIRDVSENPDCTFHSPRARVQRSGDSEGARFEILRLAEKQKLLIDPEHSQALISRLSHADKPGVARDIGEVGHDDQRRAYQLLASHLETHAELNKQSREGDSEQDKSDEAQDSEEYRLASKHETGGDVLETFLDHSESATFVKEYVGAYFDDVDPPDVGYCSDDDCPCSGFDEIPKGSGFLYVPQEVVEFRRKYPLIEDARQHRDEIAPLVAVADSFGQGVALYRIGPILVCKQGATLRNLNLAVAAADARHWWKTGQVPLRATPLARPETPPLALTDNAALSAGATGSRSLVVNLGCDSHSTNHTLENPGVTPASWTEVYTLREVVVKQELDWTFIAQKVSCPVCGKDIALIVHGIYLTRSYFVLRNVLPACGLVGCLVLARQAPSFVLLSVVLYILCLIKMGHSIATSWPGDDGRSAVEFDEVETSHRVLTGGPISGGRLISNEQGEVTFWARSKNKRSRNRSRLFGVPGVEFERRWASRILPKGLTRTRCYGVYSGRHCLFSDRATCPLWYQHSQVDVGRAHRVNVPNNANSPWCPFYTGAPGRHVVAADPTCPPRFRPACPHLLHSC